MMIFLDTNMSASQMKQYCWSSTSDSSIKNPLMSTLIFFLWSSKTMRNMYQDSIKLWLLMIWTKDTEIRAPSKNKSKGRIWEALSRDKQLLRYTKIVPLLLSELLLLLMLKPVPLILSELLNYQNPSGHFQRLFSARFLQEPANNIVPIQLSRQKLSAVKE